MFLLSSAFAALPPVSLSLISMVSWDSGASITSKLLQSTYFGWISIAQATRELGSSIRWNLAYTFPPYLDSFTNELAFLVGQAISWVPTSSTLPSVVLTGRYRRLLATDFACPFPGGPLFTAAKASEMLSSCPSAEMELSCSRLSGRSSRSKPSVSQSARR